MTTYAENHRTLDALVQREVIYCVSHLVSELAQLAAHERLNDVSYEDDILPLLEKTPDDEDILAEAGYCIAYADGSYHIVESESLERFCNLELERLVAEERGNDDAESEASDEIWDISRGTVMGSEDWSDAVDELGIERSDYASQALEHWIVSGWFAEKLRDKGECVGELLGMNIWGRCCSGQAISLDGVILSIASDMGILKGQKYEWKD